MNVDLMDKVWEAYWKDEPGGTKSALERVVAVVEQEKAAEIAALREALKEIADAPAWGYPDRWENTPAEVRQLARKALGARK